MSYPNPNSGYGYPSAPPSSSHPSYPYTQPPPPGPHSYGAPPQPGAPPQYGAPPQPGAQPQYGAPPQPGVPPQYGAPPQPGVPPQYGAPPQPDRPQYGAPPKPGPSQYGAPAPSAPPYTSEPYKPPKDSPHPTQPYGAHAPSPPYSQPASAYGGGYQPLAFPPGTDPNLIACFQVADRDGSGFIDDKELQTALSSYSQSFSIRTVHLLMYTFTNTNVHKIGPREFTSVFYSLQNWRSIFERFDRDRSGKIDASELREALLSLGFSVSPAVLDLLISKFDKSGGMNKGIEYDNFIECCITVKGLTEKFKEKDTSYTGSASFTYDTFMLTVLPFLIA